MGRISGLYKTARQRQKRRAESNHATGIFQFESVHHVYGLKRRARASLSQVIPAERTRDQPMADSKSPTYCTIGHLQIAQLGRSRSNLLIRRRGPFGVDINAKMELSGGSNSLRQGPTL